MIENIQTFIQNLSIPVMFMVEGDGYDPETGLLVRVNATYFSNDGQKTILLSRDDIVALLKNNLEVLAVSATRRGEVCFYRMIRNPFNGIDYIRITPIRCRCDISLGQPPPPDLQCFGCSDGECPSDNIGYLPPISPDYLVQSHKGQ